MKNIITVFLIILTTFFVWRGILNQSIEGEGFYYFAPPETGRGLVEFLTKFDNMPRIFTSISGSVFKGNMQGYMTTQLVVIILLAVCEYFIIKAIVKNRLIALTATLYFTLNFSGNYQIYARGHFQWFAQRVFEIFPFLFSFFFLSKFYNKEKYGYYLLSFLFFLLALLTSTYATLLVPFYPSLLFVMALTKKLPIKKRVLYLLLSLPFIIINYLIVKYSSLGDKVVNPPDINLPLIKQIEGYVLKISHQLVGATLPFSLLTFFAHTFNSSEIKIVINAPFSSIPIYKTTILITALKAFIMILAVPIYLFYTSIIVFLHKKKSPQFYIVLSSFLALIGTFFLSAYTNRFDVYGSIFESRYFYLPGFFIGIIFACFIYNLVPKKPIFIISLLLVWALYNFKLIDAKMKSSQYKYTAERIMLNHLKNISGGLPENSIIVFPLPIFDEP